MQINENEDLGSIDRVELGKYLTKNIKSRYSVSNVISAYLNTEDITIPYFRVIAMSGEKIKEAYPFPNRTFAELYQSKEENENVAQIEFEDSEFCKEVKKIFPVFVVNWKNEDDSNQVSEVKIIKNFSFKDYEEEAKQVFNATKEAFITGDDSAFTKSSENKKFHIRPKAISSEDTFEFSNGMQITKRTFWANKETVKEIIENYKEKDC